MCFCSALIGIMSQTFPSSMTSSVRKGLVQELQLMCEGVALNCNNRRTESNMVLDEGLVREAHVIQLLWIDLVSINELWLFQGNDKFEFEENPLIQRQIDRDKYQVSADIPSQWKFCWKWRFYWLGKISWDIFWFNGDSNE